MSENGKLLRAAEVALRMNIAERTLWKWVAIGSFPKPIRMPGSRLVFWRECDIEEHITALATHK